MYVESLKSLVLRHSSPQKCVSLVTLVLIWPTMCKWQARSLLEILILVPVKDDDKAVNDDMVRRWVLGTGRNRVVVE